MAKRRRKQPRASSKARSPVEKKLRVPTVRPNHKHTPLALDFYQEICGRRKLPPTGIEITQEQFDKFFVARGLLPLADIPKDDPRYRKAMNDREKWRAKVNSGAVAPDVPPDRQFQIMATSGKWLMVPAGDVAREKLNALGEKSMRGVKRQLRETEKILVVRMLTAETDDEHRKYEFALHEIGYAKTTLASVEKNLTDRGRHIAGALPGPEKSK